MEDNMNNSELFRKLIEMKTFFMNTLIILNHMRTIGNGCNDIPLQKSVQSADEGLRGILQWTNDMIKYVKGQLGSVNIPVENLDSQDTEIYKQFGIDLSKIDISKLKQ